MSSYRVLPKDGESDAKVNPKNGRLNRSKGFLERPALSFLYCMRCTHYVTVYNLSYSVQHTLSLTFPLILIVSERSGSRCHRPASSSERMYSSTVTICLELSYGMVIH